MDSAADPGSCRTLTHTTQKRRQRRTIFAHASLCVLRALRALTLLLLARTRVRANRAAHWRFCIAALLATRGAALHAFWLLPLLRAAFACCTALANMRAAAQRARILRTCCAPHFPFRSRHSVFVRAAVRRFASSHALRGILWRTARVRHRAHFSGGITLPADVASAHHSSYTFYSMGTAYALPCCCFALSTLCCLNVCCRARMDLYARCCCTHCLLAFAALGFRTDGCWFLPHGVGIPSHCSIHCRARTAFCLSASPFSASLVLLRRHHLYTRLRVAFPVGHSFRQFEDMGVLSMHETSFCGF